MTKPFPPYLGPEDNFQQAVARYLDSLNVFWWHTPNGGSRNAIEGAKLKRMGVKPGVSDVIICEPRNNFSGFVIELKTKTNHPTPAQLAFLEKMRARNYKIMVSFSLDEVIFEVGKYLSAPIPTTISKECL